MDMSVNILAHHLSFNFDNLFGFFFFFYQIRDKNRPKFKISYSCGHRVSKSAGMTPP